MAFHPEEMSIWADTSTGQRGSRFWVYQNTDVDDVTVADYFLPYFQVSDVPVSRTAFSVGSGRDILYDRGNGILYRVEFTENPPTSVSVVPLTGGGGAPQTLSVTPSRPGQLSISGGNTVLQQGIATNENQAYSGDLSDIDLGGSGVSVFQCTGASGAPDGGNGLCIHFQRLGIGGHADWQLYTSDDSNFDGIFFRWKLEAGETYGPWTQFPTALDDLSNVGINNPQLAQVLGRNATNDQWVNRFLNVENLGNTDISSPTVGQTLIWDDTSNNWVNGNITVDPQALGDLTNVVLTSPANNQVLTFNATDNAWENQAVPQPPSSALGDLTNVTLTTPTAGQVLTFNAGNSTWENQNPASPIVDLGLEELTGNNFATWTGIPDGVFAIYISVARASTGAASTVIVQLGTAADWQTAAVATSNTFNTALTPESRTAGFAVGVPAANPELHGLFTIMRQIDNGWTYSFTGSCTGEGSGDVIALGGGRRFAPDTITRVRMLNAPTGAFTLGFARAYYLRP